MSARAVARLLNVSPDYVCAEIHSGRLIAHRVGVRRFLVLERDLEAWLEARRVRPTQHSEAVVARVLEREARSSAP